MFDFEDKYTNILVFKMYCVTKLYSSTADVI